MTDTADQNTNPTNDIRPMVGRETGNRPLWIAVGGIVGAGLLLFSVLEARRSALTAPAVRPQTADLAAAPASVPPLYIPPDQIVEVPPLVTSALPPVVAVAPPAPLPRPLPAPSPMQRPEPYVQPLPAPVAPAPPVSTTPAIVYDASEGEAAVAGSGGSTGTAATTTRARAARAGNRATIVPQGTLIAAVLETAIDSTQAGQARALVSRDVANLHGERILIPRGSRLFGDYRGALEAGQNRAQVQWTRLVRPDGVTVAIDSPAADRLGRAGIKGSVNTHFLERLGSALLQSSIDVGAGIATRSISGSSVVVALPGSVQGATSQLVGPPPKPTLRIKQGTRIAVFVMRDLDFTAVEAGR